MEIKKAKERLRYHKRVLAGKINAPKLNQLEKQANVDLAQAALDLLTGKTARITFPIVPPTAKHLTREAWLEAFVDGSRKIFSDAGYTLPDNIKISIGFPSVSALSTRKQRLGECWSGKETHVFISPVLDDAIVIAGITTHELVHAAGHGKHNKAFATCGAAVGLEGKPASMDAGPIWHDLHTALMESLGPLPHHKIDTSKPEKKKQTTRLLKCECPDCGFTFRTTAKWIEGKDSLRCPDAECDGMIVLDGEGETDDD
jgi:predicted SprT family Zn-dependent metalloprotease